MGLLAGAGDKHFVVVGAYVADCLVRTPKLPAWGVDHEAQSIRTSPGGKALNQAVALARLGAKVTAVGSVGDDPLGRDVIATLEHEGVDTGGMQVQTNTATPICVCFSDDSGRTSFVWSIGAAVAATPETVRLAANCFHGADAMLGTFEVSPQTLSEAIRTAHSNDVRVIVQPAPPRSDTRDNESLPWSQVDVVVPNVPEARALLPDGQSTNTDEDLARQVADALNVLHIVVTRGREGCTVHRSGATSHHPARRAVVVDATGGSDAFTAAFTLGYAIGASESETIDAAQAAAAWAVSHGGGHESMPTAADLDWR